MLWVLQTCISRRLAQCKRNWFNPIPLARENAQHVVRFCGFRLMSTYSNKSARFGRFLRTGWSDWSDSFGIVQGILRYKFRVRNICLQELWISTFYGGDTPLRGVNKYLLAITKIVPTLYDLEIAQRKLCEIKLWKNGGNEPPYRKYYEGYGQKRFLSTKCITC
jgi:hypothetical protein